jgi:hypothetical protein
MAEAEQPERLRPEHRVTVEDVRQLMGASMPPGDPARVEGENEIARLERIAFAGEIRGQQGEDGERSLPSLGEDEPKRYVEGATRG